MSPGHEKAWESECSLDETRFVLAADKMWVKERPGRLPCHINGLFHAFEGSSLFWNPFVLIICHLALSPQVVLKEWASPLSFSLKLFLVPLFAFSFSLIRSDLFHPLLSSHIRLVRNHNCYYITSSNTSSCFIRYVQHVNCSNSLTRPRASRQLCEVAQSTSIS